MKKIAKKIFSVNLRAFTLIELLVTISVVAILAIIGTVILNGVQTQAKDSTRKSDVLAIAKALESSYNPVTGTYRILTGSDFAAGQMPTPPEGGYYFGDITTDSKAFRICAALSNGIPFCVDSEQGVYNDIPPSTGDPFMPGSYPGAPTPTPTVSPSSGPTNIPTPTLTPTSGPTGVPTPTQVPNLCPDSTWV